MTPDDLRKLADEATPGPWGWDTYAGIWEPPDGFDPDDDERIPIAKVNTGYDGSEYRADGKANARLIALAPDLARLCAELGEALDNIRDVQVGWTRPMGDEERTAIIDEICDVALAKLSELEAP
jgi:hypothetical protein